MRGGGVKSPQKGFFSSLIIFLKTFVRPGPAPRPRAPSHRWVGFFGASAVLPAPRDPRATRRELVSPFGLAHLAFRCYVSAPSGNLPFPCVGILPCCFRFIRQAQYVSGLKYCFGLPPSKIRAAQMPA